MQKEEGKQDEANKQLKRTRSYVDEVFRQIQQKPDVEQILIVNRSGVPIKTTMQQTDALQFAGLYDMLLDKVQMFMQKYEPPQELKMLRVRTNAHEVLITPDGKITVLVVQNATDKFQGS